MIPLYIISNHDRMRKTRVLMALAFLTSQTYVEVLMATIHSIKDCPPLPEVEGVEVRHVVGFPGYAIGDNGRVWSCRTYNPRSAEVSRWRRLKASVSGYLLVRLRKNGKPCTKTVPRMVAEAFLGPCPLGKEVCHGDGDKSNNLVTNLRWDTHQANIQDTIRHGTFSGLHRGGENNPRAKFTLCEVRHIRRLANTDTHTAIAAMYDVDRSTISKIVTGDRYK